MDREGRPRAQALREGSQDAGFALHLLELRPRLHREDHTGERLVELLAETISIDIAQDPHNLEMFMRYAERYGGSSAAAFSLLDSELARQGLRPNRVQSDGAALPESFDDLRRQYDRERTSPLLNSDLTSSGRGNSRRVSGFGQSTPKIAETPQPSVIRGEVEKRAAEIRQGTESSQGGFDAKAQIVRAPDGTLTTKKSLLMQSGRQVASDATESMDAAKEVAKDLLKRKK